MQGAKRSIFANDRERYNAQIARDGSKTNAAKKKQNSSTKSS